MKRSLNNQFEINNALISESNLIDCISNTFITSGSGGGGDFTNILNTNFTSTNSRITNLTVGTIDSTNIIANGTAYISNLENTNLITTSSISANVGNFNTLSAGSLYISLSGGGYIPYFESQDFYGNYIETINLVSTNLTASNINNGIFNEVSKTYTNNATTLMATFGSTVFRGVEILACNKIITSTNPRTATYKIYGYYDNNSWSISETRHGNNYGTFSITSSGSLSFTSTNEADFISATMKLRQTFISI